MSSSEIFPMQLVSVATQSLTIVEVENFIQICIEEAIEGSVCDNKVSSSPAFRKYGKELRFWVHGAGHSRVAQYHKSQTEPKLTRRITESSCKIATPRSR